MGGIGKNSLLRIARDRKVNVSSSIPNFRVNYGNIYSLERIEMFENELFGKERSIP